MSARGNTSRKIEVACDVGEVSLELKGRKSDYNYDLECGIAKLIQLLFYQKKCFVS